MRSHSLGTWVVEAGGELRLTDTHEANRDDPWRVSDAPSDYVQRSLEAIVGVEIPISKLVGKWKVNQNRSVADRMNVAKGLLSSNAADAKAMSELVTTCISTD